MPRSDDEPQINRRGISLCFAPSSANPCDNLHPKVRLLPSTEQHGADCHESGAVKKLRSCLPAAGSFVGEWRGPPCSFDH
jgi:hypothetical protein